MTRRLKIIIFVALLLAVGIFVALYLLTSRQSPIRSTFGDSLVSNNKIILETDISDKTLVFKDEVKFREYLDKIGFWGSTRNPGAKFDVKSLKIFITDQGVGRGDRFTNSSGVYSSIDYSVDESGQVLLTVHISRNFLDTRDSATINKVVSMTIIRAAYIIHINEALTEANLQILDELGNTYFSDKEPLLFSLKSKILSNLETKLLSLFVKTAKAACSGGQIECGHLAVYKTCNGADPFAGGITCDDDGDCPTNNCVTVSNCVGERGVNCSSIMEAAYCSASGACGSLMCVASGSCGWGSGPTPTPPPSDCHLVVGDGCYEGNCPEWGTGQGKGTNGCSATQYYCTGSYWAGNCCSVSSWSACSAPCGGGITTNNCGGTASCNTQACCVPTSWGPCSAACGGGTQVDNCGTTWTCNTQQCNWWQVKDSDVSTNGDLISKVPTSLYFGLVGDGGFPGVPAFSSATSLTTTNASEKGWFANTGVTAARGFGSTYFINAIPTDATINTVSESSVDGSYFESGGSSSNGYYWYVYDGATTGIDLNIVSPMSLGSRKVILIVKGANLNLGGNINLTKGSGFFLAVTSGNIVVGTTVGGGGDNLEGIYVADGTFSTGATNTQLRVRGTVVGYGGITLQRDLGAATNATTPGELFEFAPDQELLFPISLAYRLMHWREVAP